jgi:hypothetical protein
MTERFALTAGTFVAEFPFTAGAPLAPGDYDVQLRAKGVAVLSPAIDTVRLTLTSDSAGGALFLRRGPGTGNRDLSTADARFRRAERLILETPTLASASGATGRLLDRTGKPLNVPVTATIREGADGSRWRRVEITLAPLAPADYIVESTSGSERTLTRLQGRAVTRAQRRLALLILLVAVAGAVRRSTVSTVRSRAGRLRRQELQVHLGRSPARGASPLPERLESLSVTHRGMVRNAVLILHGTGGNGSVFAANPFFAPQLFAPGAVLDADRYFLIMPDVMGHGQSAKPSDGLRCEISALRLRRHRRGELSPSHRRTSRQPSAARDGHVVGWDAHMGLGRALSRLHGCAPAARQPADAGQRTKTASGGA